MNNGFTLNHLLKEVQRDLKGCCCKDGGEKAGVGFSRALQSLYDLHPVLKWRGFFLPHITKEL